MPKYLEATASTPITKTGKPFTKYRYTISLKVDELETALHAHARTYWGARKAARHLGQEAEFYIEQAGLMPMLFQVLSAQAEGRPILPAVGQSVYLAKEVAGLPEGTECLVTESEWSTEDEGCLPENTFPVMVWPIGSEGEVSPFPLAMDEYSLTAPKVAK